MSDEEEKHEPQEEQAMPTDEEILAGWASCLRAYTKAVNQGALKKIAECQEALRQYETYGPDAIKRLY